MPEAGDAFVDHLIGLIDAPDVLPALSTACTALDSLLNQFIDVHDREAPLPVWTGTAEVGLAALNRSLRTLEALTSDAASNPSSPTRDRKNGTEVGQSLSEMDARILEGVAAGVSTGQLAAQLYLSRQGVEYHISSMLRRFAVPNRTALACKAYATGVLAEGSWPPRVAPDRVIVD